jgi:hypothetical protein
MANPDPDTSNCKIRPTKSPVRERIGDGASLGLEYAAENGVIE